MGPTTKEPVFSTASGVNGQVTKRTNASSLLQASEPTLIIIFAWLGAKAPILRKYSESYRKLYPSSAQLVLDSDPVRFWKPASVRERRFELTVRYLEEHISQRPDGHPPRILLHVMSNGGVCSLVDLASAIRKRGLRAPSGIRCAIVFDSAPAPGTFPIMHRAFTAGTRNRLIKYLAIAFLLSPIYAFTMLIAILSRSPRPMQGEMAALNNPGLLPWTSTRTPRMYIYSSGDRIAPARAVEEHAERARAAGFPVQMVHFGRSGHVAHARDDPEKYWGSVKALWEKANIPAGIELCRL
ncbi:hypothetical protein C8Q73DRAFT_665283 [Cubamyces lactineus]|nr:hypothetical protein C8Q73DRAFT_665283 [Cubamyces lactineus]